MSFVIIFMTISVRTEKKHTWRIEVGIEIEMHISENFISIRRKKYNLYDLIIIEFNGCERIL